MTSCFHVMGQIRTQAIGELLTVTHQVALLNCASGTKSAIINCFVMADLCNRTGHYIFALWFLSFFLSSSSYFFPRLSSAATDWIGCLPYFHTWCGPSANLECRSEMCCTRLAGNTGRKKIATLAPSHNFVCYIFGTKAYIDNRKKTC